MRRILVGAEILVEVVLIQGLGLVPALGNIGALAAPATNGAAFVGLVVRRAVVGAVDDNRPLALALGAMGAAALLVGEVQAGHAGHTSLRLVGQTHTRSVAHVVSARKRPDHARLARIVCYHAPMHVSPMDLRRAYEAGATVEELSLDYYMSTTTVRKRLRDAGTTMRPAAPRRGKEYRREKEKPSRAHLEPAARIASRSAARLFR